MRASGAPVFRTATMGTLKQCRHAGTVQLCGMVQVHCSTARLQYTGVQRYSALQHW